MRIPLDYYRILGLPIQATVEQLQQAHRDRSLQLPRREYSDGAIEARKRLLDEAFAVLGNAERREEYDAGFLAKTSEPEPGAFPQLPPTGLRETAAKASGVDPYAPSLDIPEEQLIGALLILLELGEYELVLRLGRSYLSTTGLKLKQSLSGDLMEPVPADVILTVAFACLELGREQWQQGQYENAAESLQMGQDLLLREGLFAGIRNEIQYDLYKLRPYRVLELLALSEETLQERQHGLILLREMLQERGGIDGNGNDQSGLNIDDFLRFIQQLRSYLTVVEQQTLFEEEARRPSAVSTYLAVYALIARGFAQRLPVLIRRAKTMLLRLGSRQDVHLEQAVCALLLGQTEEASQALERSQEFEPLTFIRENSQGAPDLLPGLCLYSERWLQEEVFPHFRDLARQRVALKDYFADNQVQSYLEELPQGGDSTPEGLEPGTSYGSALRSGGREGDRSRPLPTDLGNRTFSLEPEYPAATQPGLRLESDLDLDFPNPVVSPSHRRSATGQGLPDRSQGELNAEVVRGRPEGLPLGGFEADEAAVEPGVNGRPHRSAKDSPDRSEASTRRSELKPSEKPRSVPTAYQDPEVEIPPRRSSSPKRSPKALRLALVVGIGLVGLGSLGFLATATYGWLTRTFQGAPPPALEADQPMVQLDQPLIAIPTPALSQTTPTPSPTISPSPDAPLTEAVAQQVVQAWLTAKSEGMGSNYNTDALSQILVEPLLSEWQKRVADAKQEDWYWLYKHSTPVINALEVSESNPEQATVEAEVNETAELFQQGQVNLDSSYDKTLRVQYGLIRQEGQWRIQTIALAP